MLDIKSIIKDKEYIKKNLLKKGYILPISDIIGLVNKKKAIDMEILDINKKVNLISNYIKNTHCVDKIKESADLGDILSSKKIQKINIDKDLDLILQMCPNIVDQSTPDKPEIVRTFLEEKCLPGISHMQIKDIDRESGVNVSGPKFVYLSGNIAKLHRILGQFMLDFHINNHGYTEINTPCLVKPESMTRTGQLTALAHGLYKTQDNMFLIPTSEVSLLNRYFNHIINEQSLPIKNTAITVCFRKEASKYGFTERGLIRQHQFEKVELINIIDPSKEMFYLEQITREAEKILISLQIPYRVKLLDCLDTSFASAKTYDIEAWSPGQKDFIEVSSASTCKDFQSRRLKLRIQDKNKNKYLPYTLNASGLAVGRTLIALVENHCDDNGYVTLPNAIAKYSGIDIIKVF